VVDRTVGRVTYGIQHLSEEKLHFRIDTKYVIERV
jgi:hypothetical protein